MLGPRTDRAINPYVTLEINQLIFFEKGLFLCQQPGCLLITFPLSLAPKNGTSKSVSGPAASRCLVLRHFGIDGVSSRQNSASQILGLGKSSLLQEPYGPGAASSGAAMDHHLLAGIQFIHASRKIVQRN